MIVCRVSLILLFDGLLCLLICVEWCCFVIAGFGCLLNVNDCLFGFGCLCCFWFVY